MNQLKPFEDMDTTLDVFKTNKFLKKKNNKSSPTQGNFCYFIDNTWEESQALTK